MSLDLEPVRARVGNAYMIAGAAVAVQDVVLLIAEVERLRGNFDALDTLFADHLAICSAHTPRSTSVEVHTRPESRGGHFYLGGRDTR